MMDDLEYPSFLDVLLALVAALCLTAICLLAMYMKIDGATIPLVTTAAIFTIIGWGYHRNVCLKKILGDDCTGNKGVKSTIQRNYD
jgi:hypothetical protein